LTLVGKVPLPGVKKKRKGEGGRGEKGLLHKIGLRSTLEVEKKGEGGKQWLSLLIVKVTGRGTKAGKRDSPSILKGGWVGMKRGSKGKEKNVADRVVPLGSLFLSKKGD